MRDVNGLATSSGDKCGALQVSTMDGLAVSGGRLVWCITDSVVGDVNSL